MKAGLWLVISVLLAGCVSTPTLRIPEEEGATIRLPYRVAFQRVLELLESQGYTIALADEAAGIIETLPQRVPDESGAVRHQALLSFLLRGDRNTTTVYLRVIVTADYPEKRQEMMDALEGLSP